MVNYTQNVIISSVVNVKEKIKRADQSFKAAGQTQNVLRPRIRCGKQNQSLTKLVFHTLDKQIQMVHA